MKKSLEFDLPEGCDSISFGRDLNEKGIKRRDCESNWYWDDYLWTVGADHGEFMGIYAYRLKPVAQAGEQDGILVRGTPPLPDGMTECGMGLVFPSEATKGYWLEGDEWKPFNLTDFKYPQFTYCWSITPKPDTVTVEVELPRPAEGMKWEAESLLKCENLEYYVAGYKQVPEGITPKGGSE